MEPKDLLPLPEKRVVCLHREKDEHSQRHPIVFLRSILILLFILRQPYRLLS